MVSLRNSIIIIKENIQIQMTIYKPCVSKIAFCFVLLIMSVGCFKTSYQHSGETFASPEEALAAQKTYLDKIKSQITRTEHKYGGYAVVIIPTFETISALGIKISGNPKQEMIDYAGNYTLADFRNLYACLDNRKIFDKVTLIEDNYPIPAANKIMAEYDAVIYLDLTGPGKFQWIMKVAPHYKNMMLSMDITMALGLPRIMSWLEGIQRNLNRAGYKPKR